MAEEMTPHAALRAAFSRGEKATLERKDFQRLLDVLIARGYRVIGPAVREEAIIYDEITSESELPAGWTDAQEAGTYRLRRRDDQALFGYAVGPHSWKKILFPPRLLLWKAQRDGKNLNVSQESPDGARFAFLGARSCDIHAIAVQDKVFMSVDPFYRERRESVFIVALNCGVAGGTCFCVSMKTGPKATFGFDLALTEVLEGRRHYFVIEPGTDRGVDVLAALPVSQASAGEQEQAESVCRRTASSMGRSMDTRDIKELLYRNYEHPRWDSVASRCLSCANCTMVCPTCFCSTVEEVTDLTGDHSERWRSWDSCFTADHSYIHGGVIRPTTRSRYRQWMTHKLATWIDQFGVSGCIGCGRCITWCPVGIDITEETRAIRESEMKNGDH
jgi:formate hydrogenlyase subunit 6/NADH:ubiquinone oxidoreductase subunit I